MPPSTTSPSEQSCSSPPDLSTATVSDAIFHDSVAARHRRIDVGHWDDIYVVGDVHGCYDELVRLVERIDPGSEDLFVVVGVPADEMWQEFDARGELIQVDGGPLEQLVFEVGALTCGHHVWLPSESARTLL